jgi:exonuclease III
MMLNIISLNIRGLNDPKKSLRLKRYLRTMQPQTDILLFQEHKLVGDKAKNLGKTLNPQATYLHTEVEPGYNHDLGINGAGCGGTTILIASKLEKAIAVSGSCFNGRDLWVIL